MNAKTIMLILMLFFTAGATTLWAQQRATTLTGIEVILYDDGTWEYVHNQDDFADDDVIFEEGGTGKSAEILIKNDLLFTLENGMLKNFRILHGGTRLYDNMSGKLRKIGPYEIKYGLVSERLEQVGPYKFSTIFIPTGFLKLAITALSTIFIPIKYRG